MTFREDAEQRAIAAGEEAARTIMREYAAQEMITVSWLRSLIANVYLAGARFGAGAAFDESERIARRHS